MLLDLHTHSTSSDGQYSPSELVEKAVNVGLNIYALTDHDTINGLKEADARAKKLGLVFIPGLEISSQDKEEIHILGLGIDCDNSELADACRMFSVSRSSRGYLIKDYLESIGVNVDLEVIKTYAGNGNLGRPHFARYMIENGIVSDRAEAFGKYLDTDEFRHATDRKKPSCEEAISLIHKAGGKAVLAHPGVYKTTGYELESLIKRLTCAGLDGIECVYSGHSDSQINDYLRYAKKYKLGISCGSDYHGERVKPDVSLGVDVDDSLAEHLVVRGIL